MREPARIAVAWRALSQLSSHWLLWQELVKRKHARVLVLHEHPTSVVPLSFEGLEVETTRSGIAPHPALRWVSGWRRPLEKFQPDCLLALDEPYCLQTFRFSRWAARTKIPFLFLSCQNIDRPLPFPFERFERFVFERAAGAWLLNGEALERSRRRGFRAAGKVIPLGVDPEDFAPIAEPGLSGRSKPDRPFTPGFIGRLVPEKGVSDLLEACRKIGSPLVVVGSGPEEARLKRLASDRGVEVDWKGELSGRAWLEAFRQIDALVLPSRTTASWKEQFGRVLIEAMAAGIPVVGSDSGEIPNVIGDAGWVYPEGEAGTLAEILKNLRADPARREELGRKGRERVLSSFTWAHVGEELQLLLEEAVPDLFG